MMKLEKFYEVQSLKEKLELANEVLEAAKDHFVIAAIGNGPGKGVRHDVVSIVGTERLREPLLKAVGDHIADIKSKLRELGVDPEPEAQS